MPGSAAQMPAAVVGGFTHTAPMAQTLGTLRGFHCLSNGMASTTKTAPASDEVAAPAEGHGPSGTTDEALMEAFRGGDATAFETLVSRHKRGLFNYLLRSVGSAARAEELLQEVFLRVVRSRARYKRSAKFTTWVYTIARNLTVDESRRARFRDHVSLDAPRGKDDGGGRSLLDSMEHGGPSTDAAAAIPSLRERLKAAIATLPEDQREVFLLRQVSGLSFREIGETVGAPENTVKSRMRYALEKLREELAELAADAGDGVDGRVHG